MRMAFRLRELVPAGSERLGAEEKHMHPGFIGWWHARREAMRAEGCGIGHGHGHGHGHGGGGWEASHGGGEGGFDGGSFGVRRPLRFLAFKLELDDGQVEALARILDDLKTERAQVAVDHRRSTAALADAVSADAFDAAGAAEGAALRVKGAERLRAAVVTALEKIHAILHPPQRTKLAYLLRTGTLSI